MPDKASQFHVPFGLHMWSGIVCNNPSIWKKIGNFESRLLKDDIKDIKIDKPIFVTGLARGGSTLLLEIINSFDETASHRYADYPFLFTPYFWNNFLKLTPKKKEELTERAHGDRIMITSDSPEAMEEIIWIAFFDYLHDPQQNNSIDHKQSYELFEKFYEEHIKKLLFVRAKNRYLAKNNNNVSRISYIHKLYPDARFVIPVRDPITHISSLMRQHERFKKAQDGNKRGLNHMQRVGHFEFGFDRRPINCGNSEAIKQVQDAWHNGEEIKGWALYWSHIYEYLWNTIHSNAKLRESVLFVRYEDMCNQPAQIINDVIDHAQLQRDKTLIQKWSKKVCAPQYYDVNLSGSDIELIKDITKNTAYNYGY